MVGALILMKIVSSKHGVGDGNMEEVITELKIGRFTYNITAEDVFLDNGACVQLLSQSHAFDEWRRWGIPKLSKPAAKALSKFERVIISSTGSGAFTVEKFSIAKKVSI